MKRRQAQASPKTTAPSPRGAAPAVRSAPGPSPVWQRVATRVVQRAEDWNFTRKEYGTLKAGGGDLTIAAGTNWVPGLVQSNVLATLKSLLDPARSPSATEAISLDDFYHAHVVIPKTTGMPQKVLDAKTDYEKHRESQYSKALGGSSASAVTAANLPDYRKAVEATLPHARKVLDETSQIKGAGILYHTFEGLPGGMKANDPRRNWFTPFSTNVPVPYRPPGEDADSAEQEYFYILNIAFLVDETGHIHLRPGSKQELTTVTGKPEV